MSVAVLANTPAVVLVSGGLDSAVALAIARRDGYRCYALSFDYGQRHRRELAAAALVARALGAAEHKTVSVDLRAIGGSALTGEIEVPKDRIGPDGRDDGNGPSGVPATYVPARNLIFLALAAAYAEVVGALDLFIGANAVDYSGYPDCRGPFLRAFEGAATLGTRAGDAGGRFRVHAPLIDLSKAQIVRRGAELGVDFSITHSCYDPDPMGGACGRCDSCVLRRRGFERAGVQDPAIYAGVPR